MDSFALSFLRRWALRCPYSKHYVYWKSIARMSTMLPMSELNETEKHLREQMEKARKAKGLTHAALAQKLGIKPPSVTVVLTRKRGTIPQSLLDVLDALDLELTAQPKSE